MKVDRNRIHQKYGGRCAYCGKKVKLTDMHVDHIIPKSTYKFHMETKHKVPKFLTHLQEGDVNHYDNLNPSCSVCNLQKLNYSLEDFRNELTSLMDYLQNNSRRFKLAKQYNFVQTKKLKPIIFYFENGKEDRDN